MPRNISELLDLMKDMIGLEEKLAELYQECSERFPEDNKFWLAICHQEQLHAKFIRELAALVEAHPSDFKFGRQFNAVAIKTIMTHVTDLTGKVRNGEFNRKRALIMARDLENSVLETKYHEIVSTDNMEFKSVIERIIKDTSSHKNLLAAKVART